MRSTMVLLCILAASGCGIFGGGDSGTPPDDMATVDNRDLTGVPPGADIAMLPTVPMQFDLHDDMHNFAQVNCDDARAMISAIHVVVKDQMNAAAMTATDIPCPAGKYTGEGTLTLPSATGFFDATATTVGTVQGTAMVSGFSAGQGISFHFYLFPM